MPSTSCNDRSLRVFYGFGQVAALARFSRIVLQPGHHNHAQLAQLGAAGTERLAYLSIGEDTGPSAPWQWSSVNPHWGGHYVDVGHPAWRRKVLARAERALEAGFDGLFLDTLDPPVEHLEGMDARVGLVAALRDLAGARYVMANRGFDLLEGIAPLVDGFLFEAFSTTWEDGYRALAPRELLFNVERLHVLRGTGCEVYALDYAVTESLSAFACARGATHRLPTHVSNRELTLVD
ncbi:MAG: endo alpha-1,4 polygalactosaminidase [Trueperaceae bacterium]